MKRSQIPFLAISSLLLLTFPLSYLFGTWHLPEFKTRVYPPYFIAVFSLLVILLFVSIGFWLLSKRVDKITWALFAFHLILTIPTVVFLKFPAIFLDIDMQQTSIGEVLKAMSMRIKLIPIAWMIFLVGQILFLIYYIRTTKGSPARK